MKLEIDLDVDEEVFLHYLKLEQDRKKLMAEMHERRKVYKNNLKKLEKDLVYKDASYNFVVAGIEMNDIRDKVFAKVLEQWKKEKSSVI